MKINYIRDGSPRKPVPRLEDTMLFNLMPDSNTATSEAKGSVLVCEMALSRMLSQTSEPFVIITACRKYNADGTARSRKQNIIKNRELRHELNVYGMGVHQLVGHWRECTDPTIPYEKCPKNKLKDTIERSYFTQKPSDVKLDDFLDVMVSLASKYEQDAFVFYDGEVVYLIYPDRSGNSYKTDVIGTELSLGKIGQAYSQYVSNPNVTFVFEGIETYHSNAARYGATLGGLVLPSIDEPFKSVSGLLID